MKKIIIAAGGSGGHIFPAIALGRSISALDKDAAIMYIGSDKALDRRMFEKEGVPFSTLSANKLAYKFSPGMVIVCFRLLADIFKALSMILSYKPDVVVGFGGYVSFPVIFAAGLVGIPTIAHEQNVVPGRANKLLFKFVSKIAVSFEETKDAIGRYSEKCVLTGNPIRSEISKGDRAYGMKRFGLDGNKLTILVIGGSQGAAFLNRTFIDALSIMDPGQRCSVQVIHITGVKDYEWALKAYEELGIDYRVHSFLDRIEEAYASADLVVTRSGASAIFELAFLKKPMILIPYPYAMSHQLDNARVFQQDGAAILVEEKDLSAGIFSNLILGLIKDGDKMRSLGEAAHRLSVGQASDNLAREVIALERR
ncbi:MAG: undecaprenyldiphospho-muramoylpentapeptide beta-N-acetylglucosaminyltransferase [Candidatus Omnitrophica bacterium]|nr:undecaprenyldiphospho-muramoylpentapeptide beta-N-acetylglucosaminyltransferase [Candidatus Omnitrophota bacterium]